AAPPRPVTIRRSSVPAKSAASVAVRSSIPTSSELLRAEQALAEENRNRLPTNLHHAQCGGYRPDSVLGGVGAYRDDPHGVKYRLHRAAHGELPRVLLPVVPAHRHDGQEG